MGVAAGELGEDVKVTQRRNGRTSGKNAKALAGEGAFSPAR